MKIYNTNTVSFGNIRLMQSLKHVVNKAQKKNQLSENALKIAKDLTQKEDVFEKTEPVFGEGYEWLMHKAVKDMVKK